MDDSSVRVPVICGPTASGKTRVALRLAQETPVTVVSADSRQLYRGFDVGTAKPATAERGEVPHEGIDVLEPVERASAAWWAECADAWIDDAREAGRAAVVVGGTGLYLRALFGTMFDEPVMDAVRRRSLQEVLAPMPTEELRRWVTALDADRAPLGRTQLLRALEVALLTGRRLSELHREHARPPRRRARYLLVDPGAVLAARIAERTEQMLAAGWREEVRRLVRTVPDDAPAWNASGYLAIRALEQGALSLDAARERVVIETRQYAKRQRTWFRHQLDGEDVTMLDTETPDWERGAIDWLRAGDAA